MDADHVPEARHPAGPDTVSSSVTPARMAAALHKLAGDLPDDLDDASKELGVRAVATARRLAPRRTGKLRASLRSRVTRGERGQDSAVEISAATAYAGPIHNGWPRHNIKPQPFLAQTLDKLDESGTITKVYADTIDDKIGDLP